MLDSPPWLPPHRQTCLTHIWSLGPVSFPLDAAPDPQAGGLPPHWKCEKVNSLSGKLWPVENERWEGSREVSSLSSPPSPSAKENLSCVLSGEVPWPSRHTRSAVCLPFVAHVTCVTCTAGSPLSPSVSLSFRLGLHRPRKASVRSSSPQAAF